ncbi:MAG: hypothetical protein ACRDK9_14005 [Solirubrobacterales bacterium]
MNASRTPPSTLSETLARDALRAHLGAARYSLLTAAKVADKLSDMEAHRRLAIAISEVDDIRDVYGFTIEQRLAEYAELKGIAPEERS